MIKHRGWSSLAGVMSALALSACSNLSVAVDVLDPTYVRDAMFAERQYATYASIVRAQRGSLKAQLVDQYKEFSGQLSTLLARMDALATQLSDHDLSVSVAALSAAAGPGRQWYMDMVASGDALEYIATDVRAAGALLQYQQRTPMPRELREKLTAFDAELAKEAYRREGILRSVEKDLKAAVERAAKDAGQRAADAVCKATAIQPCSRDQQDAAMVAHDKEVLNTRRRLLATHAVMQIQAAASEAAANAELRSIIGDGSLASTEYAYTVASAPDNLWRRDFNKAYASGMLGSSDMVIRLNSTADFSVKGMLLDASTVASVASKVTTQVLLLGVQMAGVPVPAARTGSTGGEAISTSSSALATSEAALAKRRAMAAAQKEAIRTLAQSILSVTPALGNELKDKDQNDDKRKALHANIDTSLSALRALLAMDGLQ